MLLNDHFSYSSSLTATMNSRFAAIRQLYDHPEQPNVSRASSSFFKRRRADNSVLCFW